MNIPNKFGDCVVDDEQFWNLIDAGRLETSNYSAEQHVKRLKEVLSRLTDNELIEFEYVRAQKKDDAYHWELWDCAYIVFKGCSDEDFSDFRSGLIAQGKDLFEQAIQR